jgi:hypothetical protein
MSLFKTYLIEKKGKILFAIKKYSTGSAEFLIIEFIANILKIFSFKLEGNIQSVLLLSNFML